MAEIRYEITLKIPVTVSCETGGDVVFDELQNYITSGGYERDGRYPFPREMLVEAMTKFFRQAMFESVLKFFETKHGAEKIQTNADTFISKADFKTHEWVYNDLKRILIETEGWKGTAKKVPMRKS